MRRAMLLAFVGVLLVLGLACGVTVSGRVDVGAADAERPCPGGTP